MTVDVLMAMEDPGAANYLAPLAKAMRQSGTRCTTIAHRRVADTLTARGIAHSVVDDKPDACALIDQIMPSLIVVGTAEDRNALGLRLIDAARRHAIPSVAAVDMIANAASRFQGTSDDPLHHLPDWLMVCDTATRDVFLDLGFAGDRVEVCGHPHYDWVRSRRRHLDQLDRQAERARHFPDAPTNRPIVVFAAEGVDQLQPTFSARTDGYTLTGRGRTDFRTAIVLEELLDAIGEMSSRPYVMVRMHPKSSRNELSSYAGEVDAYSTAGDPLALLWSSDVVVGMTSMLLVEAFLLGRPTLSIVPRREEGQLLDTTEKGLTTVATTRIEVRRTLARLLSNPTPAATTRLPTGAIDRAVKFLHQRLRKTGCAKHREQRNAQPSVWSDPVG